MQTTNKGLISGVVLYFYQSCISASSDIYKYNLKSYIEICPILSFIRPYNCSHKQAAKHPKTWCSGYCS